MKSYIPIHIILLVIALPANAQYAISFGAGVDKNQLHTDISGIPYTREQSEYGIILNISVSWQAKNWLFLKTGMSYLQKNYTYERTGPYRGMYITFINSYVQLPLMAGIEYGNRKIKGFLQTGIYGAYWIRGKMKGKIPDIYNITDTIDNTGQLVETFKLASFNEKYNFDSRKDRRFELGWTSGLDISYYLTQKSNLVLEVNYFRSLTDQQKNYMINQKARYNQTFTCTVGYIYHIKQQKSVK